MAHTPLFSVASGTLMTSAGGVTLVHGSSASERAPLTRHALVTPQWLEAHRADPTVKLIEIAGMNQDQMQAYKAGHVPGAVCWPWKKALWDDYQRDFPTTQEFARRLFEARGASVDKQVVTYCRMSHRGSLLYFALTELLGYPYVRLYDGSWTEWGNLVGVPIER